MSQAELRAKVHEAIAAGGQSLLRALAPSVAGLGDEERAAVLALVAQNRPQAFIAEFTAEVERYRGEQRSPRDAGRVAPLTGSSALVTGIEFDVERIIRGKDITAAYAETFTSEMAAQTDDFVFDTAEKFRRAFPRDFKVSEFRRRIKEARARLLAAASTTSTDTDWRGCLLRTEDGRVKSCFENVSLYLENSPEWARVLGYNEFDGGIYVLTRPPDPVSAACGEEIEDRFDTEVTRWLERKGLMVKPEAVRRVIDSVARQNPFHPVRQYLDSLPQWDRKPRIDGWLIDYCGVESSDANPNLYAEQVGAKFLISAIARILEPGCKADHVLILEGGQGIGKSTAVRILAGDDWFSDQLADMGSKDSSMQLRGAWIMELSELDVLNRAEMARAKAFISQQTERFRLPYGRRLVQMPRQCVFIGTTNSDAWLKDETGGRRFWPVRCGAIDIEGLKRDREQLWAEALERCRAGEHYWLEDRDVIQTAIEEQRGRYFDDMWQQKVIEYAEEEAALPVSSPRGSVAIPDILQRIGVETARQDHAAAQRVARCLRAAGWERFKSRDGESRQWRYRRPVDREG